MSTYSSNIMLENVERNGQDHCHREKHQGPDKKSQKKLIIASILCTIFLLGEITGGLWSNSLAIAMDAAHLLTDLVSFIVSLLSIWIATRPATRTMSFGWFRAEIIGALTSILMIWSVTGVVVYLAIDRILKEKITIDTSVMLITSTIGAIVNIFMGLVLHPHEVAGNHENNYDPERSSQRDLRAKSVHKKNLNIRAAYVHVLGDFIQSIGVFLAALTMYFEPSWAFVDPLCTFLFSILVMLTTGHITKDLINVLMEGTPAQLDYSQIEYEMSKIDDVVQCHNLRVWSLSLDRSILTAHLAIRPEVNSHSVLQRAMKRINEQFNFFETTLQIEEFCKTMNNCNQCQVPWK